MSDASDSQPDLATPDSDTKKQDSAQYLVSAIADLGEGARVDESAGMLRVKTKITKTYHPSSGHSGSESRSYDTPNPTFR